MYTIIIIITIIIVMGPKRGVGIVLVLQSTGTDRRTYPLLLLIICFTTLANIFGWHGDSGVVVVKGRRVTECVGWQFDVHGVAMGRTLTNGYKRGKKG